MFDRNGTTLVCRPEVHDAVARGLSVALGKPFAALDTPTSRRYLFKDGTTIESFTEPSSSTMPEQKRNAQQYRIIALKTIALPFFSGLVPLSIAYEIGRGISAHARHRFEVDDWPDPAFLRGSIAVLRSDAFTDIGASAGFAILIRRHALRIVGQRPEFIRKW